MTTEEALRAALVARLCSWARQVGDKRRSIDDNDPDDKINFASEAAVLTEAAAALSLPSSGDQRDAVIEECEQAIGNIVGEDPDDGEFADGHFNGRLAALTAVRRLKSVPADKEKA